MTVEADHGSDVAERVDQRRPLALNVAARREQHDTNLECLPLRRAHAYLALMQTQHPADNAEYLSPAEAAALIGISRDTIKRWEKAGRISSLRTPLGHRRFRRSDVEKLLTGAKDGAASKAAS